MMETRGLPLLPLSLLAAVLFAGCAGRIPVRTGYDRATGTWKPLPGSRASSSAAKAVVRAIPVDSAVAEALRDSAVDAAGNPVRPDSTGSFPAGTVLKGVASFYGKEFAGRNTASGEVFDPSGLTCAHRTLPFGTRLKVRYPRKSTAVELRVNDRGPQKQERMLDVSREAADQLGLTADGVGPVEAEVLP